ncbi:sensor histidine kinase [Chitinophaga sp. XS-30]|uniref:sensor histidine kinase n=1 Tax=Chitinophaga sp. XS-30 TaxID=2604421 RepID=UPI0011DD37A8|nr:ATP-binding protein [Chitinophaga sp. XS-30]QEH41874.1 sensor histidine kinase [Chitinophaga sp. XS-30]
MEDRIFYTTILLCSLLAVIIIFFITSIIRYHRRYIHLQRERITAEIKLLENERKRIATDLHDSLGPLLSTVKLNISSVEVSDQRDKMVISKSSRYIDEIISSMRQISYDLLPNTLERKGLLEAIREFTDHLGQSGLLEVNVYAMNHIHADPERDIHIFRIVQEIIHNTLKHAGAKKLDIGFSQDEKELLILIHDDGKGFDVEKAKDSRGLGLKSLEIRTDIMHGSITFRSRPGEGTHYYIRIPVR